MSARCRWQKHRKSKLEKRSSVIRDANRCEATISRTAETIAVRIAETVEGKRQGARQVSCRLRFVYTVREWKLRGEEETGTLTYPRYVSPRIKGPLGRVTGAGMDLKVLVKVRISRSTGHRAVKTISTTKRITAESRSRSRSFEFFFLVLNDRRAQHRLPSKCPKRKIDRLGSAESARGS